MKQNFSYNICIFLFICGQRVPGCLQPAARVSRRRKLHKSLVCVEDPCARARSSNVLYELLEQPELFELYEQPEQDVLHSARVPRVLSVHVTGVRGGEFAACRVGHRLLRAPVPPDLRWCRETSCSMQV